MKRERERRRRRGGENYKKKMSRPLQRASSVRTPDKPVRVVAADLSHQTTPKRSQELEQDEEEERQQRWRVSSHTHSHHDGLLLSYLPHSIRLWTKQLFQDLSPPLLPPPLPLPYTTSPLSSSAAGVLSSRSNNAAASNRGSSSSSSPCLSLSMIFLVLCVVSAMGGGVVFVITTTAWIHQSGPITALSSYPQQRYQSLKRAVLQELAFGGIMGLGTVRAREVAICAMGTENFVPCHNVTANLAAGFQNGEELQRHCKELSSSASSSSSSSMLRCLIPPPKAYRLPLRWPDSQDTVWLHNVKRPGDNHLHAAAAVRKMKRLAFCNLISLLSPSPIFSPV